MESERNDMKKIVTRIWMFLLVLALMPTQSALADWKVYYTGKAGQMFGYGGGGAFPRSPQCEAVRTSRPGFERNNSHCSGFDPPKPYVAPAPTYRPPSGQSGRPRNLSSRTRRCSRRSVCRRKQAARQRAQIAAMEQAAAAMQQQQFDQGKSTLANDLRNRLNASGGTNGQTLSDCWAARAGQAAQRGDRARRKNVRRLLYRGQGGQVRPGMPGGGNPPRSPCRRA